MTRRTVLLITRTCGIALAIAASVVSIYATQLAHLRPPPPARTTQLMLYGVVVLVVVAVRFLVFGISTGKRLALALLLSLSFSVAIGILPAVGAAWGHGISSDFQMGLFFMVIEFMAPCVLFSLILSALPIFDGWFVGGVAKK